MSRASSCGCNGKVIVMAYAFPSLSRVKNMRLSVTNFNPQLGRMWFCRSLLAERE